MFASLEKLLMWPKDAVFAPLDLLRVLACHAGFLEELQKDRPERLKRVFLPLALIASQGGGADNGEKGVLCCGLVCAVLGNVVAKMSKCDVFGEFIFFDFFYFIEFFVLCVCF